MEFNVNLDRAVKLKISYPIGAKEKLEFIYNNIVTLTDIYEVRISKNKNDRDIFITIVEGSALVRATNILTWNLLFEYTDLTESSYYFEIWNTTLDVKEYSGTLKTLKSL